MKRFNIILVLLFLSLSLSAQPAPPGSNNPAPIPGLVWLAAAGVALGVRMKGEG